MNIKPSIQSDWKHRQCKINRGSWLLLLAILFATFMAWQLKVIQSQNDLIIAYQEDFRANTETMYCAWSDFSDITK